MTRFHGDANNTQGKSVEERLRMIEAFLYNFTFEIEMLEDRINIALESIEEENYKGRLKNGIR